MTVAYEVNFDGLVGPSHHYAGLPIGNMASQDHAYTVANPRAAALQGLEKMWFLAKLGVKQAILPPAPRPLLSVLRQLGFKGDDKTVLRAAYEQAPRVLAACYSASSMWTANAATVSPSADSQDKRVHFTPANLLSNFHRALETPFTAHVLKTIFAQEKYFVHHAPLPASMNFADEGAANHTRLAPHYSEPGVELFVYGKTAFKAGAEPERYPARQTREASEAIARNHQLDASKVVFAQQAPMAIDAGAFHNDVVCVGNSDVLLYHADAFLLPEALRQALNAAADFGIHFIEVTADELSLADSVRSYLFNSQLLTLPTGETVLITPTECEEIAAAKQTVDRILAEDNPIKRAYAINCRQSMHNGGGPACLRLRVVLTDTELAACHPGVFLTENLYQGLKQWISRCYRDSLAFQDLSDPALVLEMQTALDELTKILGLGSIYYFQQ